MVNSSPLRHSAAGYASSPVSRIAFSTPTRPELSEFLTEARNSPEAHKRGFEEAQREHDRVLQAALHVIKIHRLEEETRRIAEEGRRRKELAEAEQKRVEDERRAEAQRLEDEARLQALKAKPIPRPSPPPAPPAEPPKQIEKPPPAVNGTTPQGKAAQQPAAVNGAAALRSATPSVPPATSIFGQPSTSAPTGTTAKPSTVVPPAAASQSSPRPNPFQQPVPTSAPPAAQAQANGAAISSQSAPPPTVVDRHLQIHKRLKELRANMTEAAKSNPALKAVMGDMRREIRKSIGQLTSGGLKENRVPVTKIATTLKNALQQIPSPLINPNEFVLEPREPVQGATRNEPELPSLFLYLLNQLSKAVISQFISESSADTRTADSIGQVVAKVFSEDDFLWRGKPLIDIVIAKYRVVCPVLFGLRGNEKMEQGRLRLGWQRDKTTGAWASEQEHHNRMTGLGAGFAAMTLRDFSKVKRQNPWPPTAYWTAMAGIISTPAGDISETQCTVLKAMIADCEQKFVNFYGNAAVAALRCALVDFPARVNPQTTASSSLRVLAKTLERATGLRLTPR